ncbi:DUF2934 domain-containing protein [Bradyrhizobium sp. McL0616]|uniref:DUF2934 domain-containing protein n=1 Tax=Bradyrhizobium sp. McL0616 TaxID=3415674 RepID=UPI003CEDB9C1
MAELQQLEHQLELANRMLSLVRDRPAVTRLEAFGEVIRTRIDRLKAIGFEDATRRRAYQLWEEAGRPWGRDRDFWLQAERELLSSSAPR